MRRVAAGLVSVVIATAARGVAAQAVCPTPWTLERTLVVGSAGGPVDFTNIIDMEVGRDGKIYVTQSFSPSVTVLTAQGRPDRQLGRVGQGPGEFAMMAIKVGMVGDSLWATDMEGVEVFAPNLRPAYSVNFRTAVASEESAFLPEIPLPDGTFLGNRQVNGSAWEQIDRFPLLRFSRTGAVVDTITMVARPSDRFFVEVPDVVRPGRTALLDNPLYEWSDVSWLPVVVTADRTAVLLLGDVRINDERSLLNPLGRPTSASFDLVKIGIDGDTLFKRSIPYDPRPVTRAEQEWLRDAFAARHAGDGAANSRPNPFAMDSPIIREQKRKAAREAITFPEYHPPVRRIFAGQDGTIWLLRELQMDLVDRWEVYDANGQLLGSVHIGEGEPESFPWFPRFRMMRASRDEIWGVAKEGLDVQTLRRYRLRNPCR